LGRISLPTLQSTSANVDSNINILVKPPSCPTPTVSIIVEHISVCSGNNLNQVIVVNVFSWPVMIVCGKSTLTMYTVGTRERLTHP